MDLLFTRYGVIKSNCRIAQRLSYCSKQTSKNGAVMSAENCIIKYKIPPTHL